MSNLHPLTDKIVASHPNGQFGLDDLDLSDWLADVDAIIREHTAPKKVIVESGVRFPELPDSPVAVAGTFIESGNQMQMALIGHEPVLLVQPEYEAETDVVTLLVTTVDLPPAGLVQVLESLLDGARTIVELQANEVYDDYELPDA